MLLQFACLLLLNDGVLFIKETNERMNQMNE